jgi:AAA ATPase domain
MRLVSVRVENFRSIDDSGEVQVDPNVTVLVGQNESGKTSFLQALHLCRPVQAGGGFDLDRDYPRKAVNDYRPRHDAKPDTVAVLNYQLAAAELEAINGYLGLPLLTELRLSTTHHHKNGYTVGIRIDETPYVRHLIERSSLSADVRGECVAAPTLRAVIKLLGEKDLNADGKEFLAALVARFKPAENKWDSLLEQEVWTKFIKPALPKFFYFDDYFLLPGKANLKTLAERAANPAQQSEEDRTVLSLLELAGVNLQDLTTPQGYEQIKSRLEGLQNSITDRIIEFWTQNQELEVEFDIREDPQDKPPFNQGANLYLRIKNRRHRVTVPFSQRSKGFIWFFSFIVRFDTIRRQLSAGDQLVLLLDEPGHSLHAVAQRDFLRYIDALSKRHQILYTTHSPFMIRGDRLDQVRIVEDREDEGSVVSPDLADADPNTLFPLQAALGYSVAEKLLRAKRNLLVGGPAELVYLTFFSSAVERAGRGGLREDIDTVPAGGLDRMATLIALLGTGPTELVIVHDWPGAPDAQADEFAERRLVKTKFVLNYGQFRDIKVKGKAAPAPAPATDIEDLFAVPLYLKLFNGAFAEELPKEVKEGDLPPGDRIVERLTAYLAENSVLLRSKGGFDRYAVATYLAANPPKAIDKETLARFEELFRKANSLFSPAE